MKNNQENIVVVKTYSNQMESQLAQLNLESVGIKSYIRKDDCGGAYPQLQATEGVRLLVDKNNFKKAETILNEMESEKLQDRHKTEKPGNSFAWGIFIAGIITGALLSFMVITNQNKTGADEYNKLEFDINGDGKSDEFHYFEKGRLTKIEEDRNYDGSPDAWFFYKSEQIVNSELDNNFDGKPDGWADYTDRNNFKIQYDNDFDGTADATYLYKDGNRKQIDWHPGRASIISRRELFTNSVKTQELIDSNHDGKFDIKISFDAFEKEVGRTSFSD